jgi:hypothetical protein
MLTSGGGVRVASTSSGGGVRITVISGAAFTSGGGVRVTLSSGGGVPGPSLTCGGGVGSGAVSAGSVDGAAATLRRRSRRVQAPIVSGLYFFGRRRQDFGWRGQRTRIESTNRSRLGRERSRLGVDVDPRAAAAATERTLLARHRRGRRPDRHRDGNRVDGVHGTRHRADVSGVGRLLRRRSELTVVTFDLVGKLRGDGRHRLVQRRRRRLAADDRDTARLRRGPLAHERRRKIA